MIHLKKARAIYIQRLRWNNRWPSYKLVDNIRNLENAIFQKTGNKSINLLTRMFFYPSALQADITVVAPEEQERRAMAIANGCKNEECIDNVLAERGFVNSPAPPLVMIDEVDADVDVDVVTDAIGAFDIEDDKEDEEDEHIYILSSLENLGATCLDPWYAMYHYSHLPLVECLSAMMALDKKEK